MPRSNVAEKPQPRLAWFLAGQLSGIDEPGPNYDAARAMVDELTIRKAVTSLDVAAVTSLLSLALTVDSLPSDARLWAQYRQAIDEVRALDRTSEEDDDDWTRGLASTAAPVGATPIRHPSQPRTRKPRASGGRGGAADGQGADAAPAAGVGRRSRAGT